MRASKREEAAARRDAGGDLRTEQLGGGLGTNFTANVKAPQPSLYGVRQASEALVATVPVNSHRRLVVAVRDSAVLLRVEEHADETATFTPRGRVTIRREQLDDAIRGLLDARALILDRGGRS